MRFGAALAAKAGNVDTRVARSISLPKFQWDVPHCCTEWTSLGLAVGPFGNSLVSLG